MNSTQIQRLINLIKRTGDRCVIIDNDSDEILTLMRLQDYEKMLNSSWGEPLEDLSEKQMMEKINRDISYWKSFQEESEEGECACGNCSHAEKRKDFENEMEEVAAITDVNEYDEEDFVEEERVVFEPITDNPEIRSVSETDSLEKKENLSEEDKDTFLLEPV